jgi:hypothetical protein
MASEMEGGCQSDNGEERTSSLPTEERELWRANIKGGYLRADYSLRRLQNRLCDGNQWVIRTLPLEINSISLNIDLLGARLHMAS